MSRPLAAATAAVGALLALGSVLVDHVGPGGRSLVGGSTDFGHEQCIAFVLGAALLLAALPWTRLPRSSFGDEQRTGNAARRLSGWRAPALVAALGLAGFVSLYRLGTASWHPDEVFYSQVSVDYVRDGSFTENIEHPFLAKYLIGASQVALGVGEWAARLPAALAGLFTGAVLFVFGRRAAGFWVGLLAFLLWSLLPHPSIVEGGELAPIKIERFALLDVFMVALFAAAVYAGWRWTRSGAWRWAIAPGVLAGLAAASKVPGFLALVPVVALGTWVLPRSRRTAAQALVLAAAALASFLLTYLPLGGDAPDTVADMVRFQREHASTGHPLLIGDRIYNHPPCWANLWIQWKAMGALSTVALAVLAGCSPFVVHRRLAGYLLLVAATALAFYALAAPFALPHYYIAWMAPVTLLAALTLGGLVARGGWGRLAAAALALPLALSALGTVRDVAALRPADYAAVANLLERERLDALRVDVIGYPDVLRDYLPPPSSAPDPAQRVVVLDPVVVRRVDPTGKRFAPPPEAFVLRRVDRLRVYLPRARRNP